MPAPMMVMFMALSYEVLRLQLTGFAYYENFSSISLGADNKGLQKSLQQEVSSRSTEASYLITAYYALLMTLSLVPPDSHKLSHELEKFSHR
jgi:hypothetical protein